MPRVARVKSYDSIYHIMIKSIKEVMLFEDEADKKKFLSIMKYYQRLYEFKILSYCLMDNHAHFIIDANGADISRIMHDINFYYAQYYNGRHDRYGHLFHDRFKSKIVENERYLYVLSAYIHNNPTDINGYEEHPENYFYSSLGVYLGLRSDPFNLVEDSFILGMLGNKENTARKSYLKLVNICGNLKLDIDLDVEFENEGTEYRSYRKLLVRNFKPEDVVDFIAKNMNINKITLQAKYQRNLVEAKAILVFIMRSICNLKCGEISNNLDNLSQTRISRLASIGVGLIDKQEKYRNIVQGFINCYSSQ